MEMRKRGLGIPPTEIPDEEPYEEVQVGELLLDLGILFALTYLLAGLLELQSASRYVRSMCHFSKRPCIRCPWAGPTGF